MLGIERFKGSSHLNISGKAEWLREKCREVGRNLKSQFIGENQTQLAFQTADRLTSNTIPLLESGILPISTRIKSLDIPTRTRTLEEKEASLITAPDEVQKPQKPIDRAGDLASQYLKEITIIEKSTEAEKDLLGGDTSVWLEEIEEITKEAKIKREAADRGATATSVWVDFFESKRKKSRFDYLDTLKETCQGVVECVQDGLRTAKDLLIVNTLTKAPTYAAILRDPRLKIALKATTIFGGATALVLGLDPNFMKDIENIARDLGFNQFGGFVDIDPGLDLPEPGNIIQDYDPWDYQAPEPDLPPQESVSVDTTPLQETDSSSIDVPADILPDDSLLDQIQLGQPVDPQIRDLAESMPGNLDDNVARLYRDFYVKSEENFRTTVDTILDNPDQFSAYTNQTAQTQREAMDLVDQQLKEGITPSLNSIQKAMHYSHPV